MLYNNSQQLLQILHSNQLSAQKKLGQNFLINPKIITKIVSAAQISPLETIVEIGPGLGILTDQLLKAGAAVETIEIDSKLIPYLQKQFQNTNLIIHHQDALTFTPPDRPYKLIANIPYYITSPLIQHFLNPPQGSLRPSTMTLLIQKEVATKICAKPGDHTVLSLQTQLFGQPRQLFTVAAGNFYPAPKVNSAVIQIQTHSQPLTNKISIFLAVIKHCFSQKRKKLTNTLQSYLQQTKSDHSSSELLTKLKISLDSRPQHLSINQWISIIDLL